MNVILDTRAVSGGTYSVAIDLLDEDGFDITPISVTWSLFDQSGSIINSRENVAVEVPSAHFSLLMSGDDILVGSDEEELRILRVTTRYSNNLATGLTHYLNIHFWVGSDSIKSMLFLKTQIISQIRAQVLAVFNQSGVVPSSSITDEYLWRSIRTAEGQLERSLGVFLTPVTVLSDLATAEEIQELDRRGIRYKIDPGYDLEPSNLLRTWSWISTKFKPIISVESIHIAMPFAPSAYQVPSSWIHADKEAGVIQLIPSSLGWFQNQVGVSAMGYTSVPQAVKVRYRAGLTRALKEYPEIYDIICRLAVASIVQGSFSGIGGSVSIDGMSESKSGPDFREYSSATDSMVRNLRNSFLGIQMRVI